MRQAHHLQPDPVLPGQESVWDYPRPASAEPTIRHIRIVHKGITLADSRAPWRTLEISHPPTYCIPRSDIPMAQLAAPGALAVRMEGAGGLSGCGDRG